MKTALILDDIPESQTWLSQALEAVYPGIALHCAGNLAEARAWLSAHPAPALALIDLELPDGSGVELIAELNGSAPQTLCVVASIFDDNEHIFPALRAGARGYLLKDQPLAQIVALLKGITEGHPPLSPAIARKMLGYFQPAPQPVRERLTERETDVLRCIAKGLTLSETAKLLGISPHTASGYVKDIYRKLNVSSRAEAALTARNMGIV
ncbi:MAG: LuxR family two component transcriptional regulator [Gallionellaceae bacterium]|jgi:DNA-binding NarL/FixJ family response regulator|nr:MAG: LuxR family two component transcriptional regulator [Gallionellaceae bacterium]